MGDKEPFDVSFGVMGVRNLPDEVTKPTLEINVCGAKQDVKMETEKYL